jgi:hypothetical protein
VQHSHAGQNPGARNNKTANGIPSQTSPAAKKFKAAPAADKVMPTAFCDVHSEFTRIGATGNSERHVRMLQKLKERVRGVCPDMQQGFLQQCEAS